MSNPLETYRLLRLEEKEAFLKLRSIEGIKILCAHLDKLESTNLNKLVKEEDPEVRGFVKGIRAVKRLLQYPAISKAEDLDSMTKAVIGFDSSSSQERRNVER